MMGEGIWGVKCVLGMTLPKIPILDMRSAGSRQVSAGLGSAFGICEGMMFPSSSPPHWLLRLVSTLPAPPVSILPLRPMGGCTAGPVGAEIGDAWPQRRAVLCCGSTVPGWKEVAEHQGCALLGDMQPRNLGPGRSRTRNRRLRKLLQRPLPAPTFHNEVQPHGEKMMDRGMEPKRL